MAVLQYNVIYGYRNLNSIQFFTSYKTSFFNFFSNHGKNVTITLSWWATNNQLLAGFAQWAIDC